MKGFNSNLELIIKKTEIIDNLNESMVLLTGLIFYKCLNFSAHGDLRIILFFDFSGKGPTNP